MGVPESRLVSDVSQAPDVNTVKSPTYVIVLEALATE